MSGHCSALLLGKIHFIKAISFRSFLKNSFAFFLRLTRKFVVMTFIVKARPGSPSAVDILASLVLLRKAHNHFWRTERNTAAGRSTFPSFVAFRRDKITLTGKLRAVNPRLDDTRCVLWPVVVSGRIACVQAELLAFHRDTSRMALFTSKRFAKTRACHDNFPHLKGNIRSFSTSSEIIMSKSHIFLQPTFISLHEKALGGTFRGAEMFVVKMFSVITSLVEKESHTPFNSKVCGSNFSRFLCFAPSRQKSPHNYRLVVQDCDVRAIQRAADVEI